MLSGSPEVVTAWHEGEATSGLCWWPNLRIKLKTNWNIIWSHFCILAITIDGVYGNDLGLVPWEGFLLIRPSPVCVFESGNLWKIAFLYTGLAERDWFGLPLVPVANDWNFGLENLCFFACTEMQSSIMFDNLISDDSLDIVISRIRISESFDDLRSQKQMRVLKLMHDNLIASYQAIRPDTADEK